MLKKLKKLLPFSVKRRIGILSVKLLRLTLKRLDDLVRVATHHGLDLTSELPEDLHKLINTWQQPNSSLNYTVNDFLILSEAKPEAPRTVETSIIIPVFNKADYTFQCLRSLFREIDLTSAEIIVIDNASSDETQQMLALLKNRVRVIRNETNKGFVEACNQGANLARGRYLVFLNNDTIVQPDWLKAMVETVESDEKAGAVGSMLVYPNGRMQEAGGIVWNDASARAYGHGEHPEDPRFNFAREVDYCSGASLLIRKELFDRLSGFDMRYAPAYYEDTDLCMSVRAAGYKVIFQPTSRIIHYEGVTAGKSTQSGYKRFQEINRRKFFEKWQTVLERDHLPNDLANAEAASDRRKGVQIVVFIDHPPKPDKDSGGVRMTAILQTLIGFARVKLVSIYQAPENKFYERELGKLGIETAWVIDFEKRYSRQSFDVAILSFPHVADYVFPLVKRKMPAAKVIYDTVDVHFVRLEREYELIRNEELAKEAAELKKIETRIARLADEVWCVTEKDKLFLQKEVPEAKIEIVSNIHTLHSGGKTFAERQGIFFIGGFVHRPNLDAVIYFLDEIFPLVLKKLPDVVFHIVGSHTPPEIFARSSGNVEVHGYVRDVTPFFENCRVFAAPLRYGAGMKGKIGQALSFGLPAVTTGIGAEGMNLSDGNEILLAEDAATFAEKIAAAYTDELLWRRLSENGYKFIEENFSPQEIKRKIESLLLNTVDGKRQLRG